jgi:hypothetical protein
MILENLKNAFLIQGKACENLGSPFTARLMRVLSEKLPQTGAVWSRIQNWDGDVSYKGASVPLRMAGALHGLVIEGVDLPLKQVYPPNHHNVTDEKLWLAIEGAVRRYPEFILERLQFAPQTNEVRRSSALMLGFQEIAARTGINDLVTSELGGSAGLNMYWDRYGYSFGGKTLGDPDSTVVLSPDWQGPEPQVLPLQVTSRAACDMNPINVTDAAMRRRLLSYIWADQDDRLELTEGAVNICRNGHETVEKSDAIVWLKDRLKTQHNGAVHVIYHTIAWQYFPKAKQVEGTALLAESGLRATRDAPLAHLSLEADDNPDGASLTLTIWPGGEIISLARVDFHGRWIKII